jgi:serine/threonine-protein kinase
MGLVKFGRYEVISEIGRGGMSTVYCAFDPRFQREVAIKVMPHELLHDPSFRLRFEREAHAIAALEEGAIVPVYDFGEENGLPYLVMRFMPGGSLEDRLQDSTVTLAETARIFARLAPAIDVAHARGIVHRDIKPGNILFDARGDPYLSDFGIVKLAEGTSNTLTGTAILGTPAYMSPEQGRGDSDIDGRSDIYSLGSILFRMLSGKLPYEAATPTGLIIKHITEPIPNLLSLQPNLPVSCQFIIDRAMAKDRVQRFGTAAELAQALAMVAGGGVWPGLRVPSVEIAAPVAVLSGVGQAGPPATMLSGSPVSTGGVAETQAGGLRTRLLPQAAPVAPAAETIHGRPARKKFPGGALALGLALILLLVFGFGAGAAVLVVFPRLQSRPPAVTEPADTPSALAAAAPYASLPSVTLLPTSTATLYPSATASPTPTATSLPGLVVTSTSAILRTGPGETYPEIASYSTGDRLKTVGRSPDGQWLALSDEAVLLGWIALADVELGFDLNTLPVIDPQPTPTPTVTQTYPPPPPPTETPRPRKKDPAPTATRRVPPPRPTDTRKPPPYP